MALFDKLSSFSGRRSRRADLERIMRNLENVLNSRREYSAPLLPDFGIRTLTEYGAREAVSVAVIQDVKECIDRYEPRLSLKEIALDEERSPLKLSFTLKCTLRDGAHELQISFDTVLSTFDVAKR